MSPLGRSADINNELQAEDEQRIEIRPDTTVLLEPGMTGLTDLPKYGDAMVHPVIPSSNRPVVLGLIFDTLFIFRLQFFIDICNSTKWGQISYGIPGFWQIS